MSAQVGIWVVVKIMVPFWVPIILGAVLYLDPKRDHDFDNHPYEYPGRYIPIIFHPTLRLQLASHLMEMPLPGRFIYLCLGSDEEACLESQVAQKNGLLFPKVAQNPKNIAPNFGLLAFQVPGDPVQHHSYKV